MKLACLTLLIVCLALVSLTLGNKERARLFMPKTYSEIQLPNQIREHLRNACFDCHSNETKWPWYSNIYPLTLLFSLDVERGRQELNFSQWMSYPEKFKLKKLQWMSRALTEKKMPPWSYRLMHSEARLSEVAQKGLNDWLTANINDLSKTLNINN
jgi:hypothetical protein